jgi:predicted dehydrogenase
LAGGSARGHRQGISRSVRTLAEAEDTARLDPAILYARDLVKAGYICEVFTADLNIVAQAMRSPEPRD